MNITKEMLEKLYYRWWCDACKDINPADRARLRCAVSIVEAYLSEVVWEQIVGAWKVAPADTDSVEWSARIMTSIHAKMKAEAIKIKMLAARHPDVLVSIAGVINGVRHASNRESAIRVMLLLDVIDNDNVEMFTDVMVGEGYRKSAKTIYFPLKEPAVFEVCDAVAKALKDNKTLSLKVDALYKRKAYIITRALNLAPVLQAVA